MRANSHFVMHSYYLLVKICGLHFLIFHVDLGLTGDSSLSQTRISGLTKVFGLRTRNSCVDTGNSGVDPNFHFKSYECVIFFVIPRHAYAYLYAPPHTISQVTLALILLVARHPPTILMLQFAPREQKGTKVLSSSIPITMMKKMSFCRTLL